MNRDRKSFSEMGVDIRSAKLNFQMTLSSRCPRRRLILNSLLTLERETQSVSFEVSLKAGQRVTSLLYSPTI